MNISVMYKYQRSCDFSTRSAWVSSNRLVRAQLYAKTDGWIAEEGRVLRRVRNRSVLCTPMRDNLSSYVCKKIVKKVDNQQKMIQKGVLLSCSYSRSVMLLPGSDA